jgi:hypothetical protein
MIFLMGGVWGIFAALGIIVAQRLLPTAVATASAIFMSSAAVSSALGGLAGGLGVAFPGLPQVFFIPATFPLLATIGLALMARTSGRLSGPAPAALAVLAGTPSRRARCTRGVNRRSAPTPHPVQDCVLDRSPVVAQ